MIQHLDIERGIDEGNNDEGNCDESNYLLNEIEVSFYISNTKHFINSLFKNCCIFAYFLICQAAFYF